MDLSPTGFGSPPLSPAQLLNPHIHRVPAVLQHPVGARVFVDLHGNAGRVIRALDASRPGTLLHTHGEGNAADGLLITTA